MIEYKFNEDKLIEELKEYINSTYDQHYATDKYQATDIIIDSGHGTGFCLGNVIKYAKRYGRKGTLEESRKDLMKILHYAIIQLYVHDQKPKSSDFTSFDGMNNYYEFETHGFADSASYDEYNIEFEYGGDFVIDASDCNIDWHAEYGQSFDIGTISNTGTIEISVPDPEEETNEEK